MEYDNPRRCLPHNLSYPNYIYNDRNVPLALAHNTRENPRGYPIGGPVGGMHNRASMEEQMMGSGPARRRIAIACARCRKRKIRCSGDPGTGLGCTNCQSAGVDPTLCQFHRVGSDTVHKVLDDRSMAYSLSSMANANNMVSMYSTGSNSAHYPRPMPTEQYPQLDTKPVYQSTWSLPYSEDTSPVDAYNLDQPTAYPSQSPAMANTGMYSPTFRWTQPTAKPVQHGSTYFDQDLQFAHTNSRLATSSDLSPTNSGLSSLRLSSLPDRTQPRHCLPLDYGVPQRQLPMPQPSPAQTNRNVVDQIQDARLRSTQVVGTSAMDNRTSFSKPLSWVTADSDSLTNASGTVTTDAFTQGIIPAAPGNTESRMSYMPSSPSTADGATTRATASQLELNFNPPGLLDAMGVPAPASNYSYVRENRQMTRPASQTNLYSYSPDSLSKRNSLGGESSNDCALVSGHRYTPLSHPKTQSSPGNRSLHHDSCQNRNLQLHRTSMGNLNSTY